MGIAASSALRVDETAYGSLEGLGMGMGMGAGPRKLKKKPVLVLDAEELAAAHAAFHEASAEQLGETVERAPKPAMILGLAPMDQDDANEMGQADDVAEDADTGQPSPEDVLALTRRKSAPVVGSVLDIPDDEFSSDDAEDAIGPGPLERLGTIEDGLDIANRIFPSLATAKQPEDAEEESAPIAFPASFSQSIAPESDTSAAQADKVENQQPERGAEQENKLSEDKDNDAHAAKPSALDAIAKRVEDNKSPASPSFEAAENSPTSVEVNQDTQEDDESASSPPVDPQTLGTSEELAGREASGTADDVYDLGEWLADDQDSVATSGSATEPEIGPEIGPEPEAARQPDEEAILDLEVEATEDQLRIPEQPLDNDATAARDGDSDRDETLEEEAALAEEDVIDGYAFLQAQPSRRTGATIVQRGTQSALRAKLLKSSKDIESTERKNGVTDGRSVLAQAWRWMRDIFSR